MKREPTFAEKNLRWNVAARTGTWRHSTPQKIARYLRARSPMIVGVCVGFVVVVGLFLAAFVIVDYLASR